MQHTKRRISLTLPDLTPNPGLWWYFFTEMFDHFRLFFLMVFSVRSFFSDPKTSHHDILKGTSPYLYRTDMHKISVSGLAFGVN